MYADAAVSTTTRARSNSTIAALLRGKEKCSNKLSTLNFKEDKEVWSSYSGVSDIGVIQISSSDSKNQPSPTQVSNSENSQESLEHQKDFNYSQKLFHIADGNLYSIFSPIQGRSYGMKPSFLRKQKYTVQECHGRGRKNLRKGLKFHNFLPSESVTSEKDNGYANAKWKVYSECRLREEHGTKQIAISNWSQSVQKPPDEMPTTLITTPDSPLPVNNARESISLLPTENQKDISKPDCILSDPYEFNSNSHSYNFNQESPSCSKSSSSETALKNFSSPPSKKDSLNILLNSLIQKPLLSEKNNYPNNADIQHKSFQKHRRKPVQTRRIVPYNKYLSIMEENETLPLDLSSKCLIENSPSHSFTSSDDSQNIAGKNDLDFSMDTSDVDCDKNIQNSISSYISGDKNFLVPSSTSDKLMHSRSPEGVVQSPVTVLCPFPINKNLNLMQQKGLFPPLPPLIGPSSSMTGIKTNQNSQTISVDKSYGTVNQFLPNNSQFSVQKSVVKEVQSKPRRRNQRSVMKQKLEDSFRQNGFLVKTKQVSDGEATFCKFRQLRKCTRYYLKSLEQHLPDEFHKMLKGFLPPKTVLPPVLGVTEPTSENLT